MYYERLGTGPVGVVGHLDNIRIYAAELGGLVLGGWNTM